MTTTTEERITLATLPSGSPLETTVHIYESGVPGPTVYVQAAQHGHEVNGTAVLRRVHERLGSTSFAGQVVAVPVTNPLTFDTVSYTAPECFDGTNANMNRVWPGDATGSLHERMAAKLWEYAEQADVILDLHTGSPETMSHVVVTSEDSDSIEIGEAYGTDLLLHEEAHEKADEEWHARNFGGKLRVAAANAGIPTITPEIGFNKWLLHEEIDTAVTGFFNVLRQLEMLDEPPVENGESIHARNHLGRVRAETSGLFTPDPDREVGEFISSGERVGTLHDPQTFEKRQSVEADRDGILYQIQREATVVGGDMLLSVALKL